MPIIIEIKAKCNQPEQVRAVLDNQNARFLGIDHQIDTYFIVPEGRLKLREGNIEHHLIHYHRDNQAGPKKSSVTLYNPKPDGQLKALLTKALGILTVVDKKREIYFVDNVKFHIDEVQELGAFMEIEAIDEDGSLSEAQLLEQCERFMALCAIEKTDLIEVSYSDLLLQIPQN